MRYASSIVSFVLMVLLAGCATQRFDDKPLVPAQTLSGYEARNLDSPELRSFLEHNLEHDLTPWPRSTWDLNLLTLAAFYYHPDLDLARAKWGVARAGVITAGQRPNPVLSVSAQFNVDALPGISPWTAGPQIDIPIETANKRGYRIAQAERQSDVARLQIDDAAWQVRSRVRAGLLGLLTSEPQLQRRRALQQEILKMLERRLELGLIPQPEVTQARLTLAQIDLLLSELAKQRAEQQARLAAALGISVVALEGVAFDLGAVAQIPQAAAIPPQTAQREALLNRPDILAALADYQAAQAVLQLELAKQYPDIHLGPGYSWDAGDSKWGLGLSLELPIFNRNQGPIAEAAARRKQSAANFLALQARAIAEVEQARASYEFALRQLQAADDALQAQHRSEATTASLFRAGEADRLALLSAQYETATAEQARSEVLFQAQQAQGQIEDALRRPLGIAKLPLGQLETPSRGDAAR